MSPLYYDEPQSVHVLYTSLLPQAIVAARRVFSRYHSSCHQIYTSAPPPLSVGTSLSRFHTLRLALCRIVYTGALSSVLSLCTRCLRELFLYLDARIKNGYLLKGISIQPPRLFGLVCSACRSCHRRRVIITTTPTSASCRSGGGRSTRRYRTYSGF